MNERAESAGAVFREEGEDAETLQRFRNLVNAVDDGIFQLDAEGRFVALNAAVEEATGYRREELLGDHVSELLDGEHSTIERGLTDPDAGGEQLALTARTADGERVRLDVHVSRLDGDEAGTVATVRDVRSAAQRGGSAAGEERGAAAGVDQRGAAAGDDQRGGSAAVDDEDRAPTADGENREPTADDGGDGRPVDRRPDRDRVLEALEAAREGISLLDEHGEFVYVNDAYADTFGYDPEEMLGEHWDDLGIEADPDRLTEEILPQIADEGQWTGTTTCVRSDGSTFRSQHSLTHTQGDELICLVRDVSDRERRKQDLERYETIVEAVNDGVYVVDDDGRFTMVNDAYAELLGYEREELLGEHVSMVVDEAVLEQAKQLESALRDDDADDVAIEAELETADGRDVVAEATFAMLPGGGGRGQRVGVVRDVTERNRTEQRLAEERDMFAQGPAVVFRWKNEPGWPVEYVSENVADVLGYEPEELESGDVPYTDLLHEEDIDRIAREVAENCDETTERFSHEPYRVRTSDGDVRWVDDRTKIIRDEDGGITHYLGYLVDITERKEHERDLEESERRYRTLVENFSNGAVALVDEELRFETVGGTPVDASADAAADLEGDHVEEALTPTLADAVVPKYRAAFEGESSAFELEHDGNYSRIRIFPVRDDDGEVFAAMGMSQDVTEREAAKRKLEASERRHRTLVENFPNGAVAMFDDDLRYTAAGGELVGDLETVGDEIEGQTIWERYPEALAEQLEPKFWSAVEDGTSSEFEIAFRDRHWRAYTLPVTDDDGQVSAGMMMIQDVTEQVEREAALEESKNQLRALIELLPVAVFVAEADGEIVEWNEAAEEIWGGEVAESDSIAEYDAYDGWWADSGEPVEPEEWALARALRGEEVTDPDVVEIEGFDGERRTVLNHGMPVRDADGEVSRAVVTLTDVTERREYQRRLEESNERLEQFAYAASHDLQEPLRMVSSYLQLVERRYADDLDEDGREFIGYAVDGAERMRDMIEGLLEYSRVETRGDTFGPVDMNDVLEDVREDLQVRIEESGADVDVASLPRVCGDEEQLRQVFQNLFDNAIEYSGDEPPQIEVTADRRCEEWAIAVRDSGIGIDPEQTDRVFEIFHSLHGPDDHSGTGIGLALCQRIVERHGGELAVESEPGGGSTFTVTLPAVDDGEA